MQRICCVTTGVGFVLLTILLIAGDWSSARADLIRHRPTRSFPDIAGDIVGAQTYTYDPISKTGTFEFANAPHLISLGPAHEEMHQLQPDRDGTLSQSLKMKLDRDGRLLDSPLNKFEVWGTVVIGDRTYQGLLLEGKPTAFGAEAQDAATVRNPDVFDLNMRITGGKLREKFGEEAYLRIVPQANSTFQGQFTTDFSGEKPLTSLRAARRLPASTPEPTVLFTLMTCGAGLLACRIRRSFQRRACGRG